MIPDNRVLFEFLLLLYLLLIVVPIPKIVIASDMLQYSLNDSCEGVFVLVVDG